MIDTRSWTWSPVFSWLQENGNVATAEMYRTFNCGVGMVVCVRESEVDAALSSFSANGIDAWRLGRIQEGNGEVVLAS